MKLSANKLTKLWKQKHQTRRKQKPKTKDNTNQARTLREPRQPTNLRNRTIKNNRRVGRKQKSSNAISKTPVLNAIHNISKTSTSTSPSPKPGSLFAYAHSALKNKQASFISPTRYSSLLVKGGKPQKRKTGRKANQKRSSKKKSKKSKTAKKALTSAEVSSPSSRSLPLGWSHGFLKTS